MKVDIGDYTGRCQVYSIEQWLLEKRHGKPYYKVREEELTALDRASEKFFDTVQSVLNVTINKFYYSKKKRKIKVRIDPWDTYSADHTLAHIIHPILLRLKDDKWGLPAVDDEDVPEHFRRSAAPPVENEYDLDENWAPRWEYVLDEMIHAFACTIDEDWESQFHSGEHDYSWVPSDTECDGEKTYQMKYGPNHTHIFDKDGYDKAWARRNEGMRLFGKYYHALWT